MWRAELIYDDYSKKNSIQVTLEIYASPRKHIYSSGTTSNQAEIVSA